MDKRLTFNSDPGNYDRLRPTYSNKLFNDLLNYSRLDNKMEALEIGIGTGQATTPILETGCNITAIEIGNKLADFAREKFSNYINLNIINHDFEKVNLEENKYDLIYSASAFHWIPLDAGLTKVMKLLKSGGVFAWFSVSPLPAMEHRHINDKIQNIYGKYSEYFGNYEAKKDLERLNDEVDKKLASRVDALVNYSFTDIQNETYYCSRTFKAEDYATMISTFSDHKAMPIEIRRKFLEEIVETINKYGGEFTLSDKMILCMGRKK